VLDLTPALREADRPLGGTYYEYDGHWTAVGHRAAAMAIREWLTAQGWLPSCAGKAR
jgi:hypothetical protein